MKDLITYTEFVDKYNFPQYILDSFRKFLIDEYSIKLDTDKYKLNYWQYFYQVWEENTLPAKDYYKSININEELNKLEENWKNLTNNEKYCISRLIISGYNNWQHNPICKFAFQHLMDIK